MNTNKETSDSLRNIYSPVCQKAATTKEILERRKLALFQAEHFVRHALSGLIVFALAVTVDVFVTHAIVKRSLSKPAPTPPPAPVVIQWPTGEPETNRATRLPFVPKSGEKLELGFSADGHVVWRPAK